MKMGEREIARKLSEVYITILKDEGNNDPFEVFANICKTINSRRSDLSANVKLEILYNCLSFLKNLFNLSKDD